MPKHKFRNSQPIPEILEDGDYILRVVECEESISKGRKTNGAPQLELKLKEESTGKIIYETLIFDESLEWKIDCFIQCFGIEAEEGEDLELEADDMIGLRGWVALKTEEYNDKKRNRVAMFYIDKEKLEAIESDPFDDPGEQEGDVPF